MVANVVIRSREYTSTIFLLSIWIYSSLLEYNDYIAYPSSKKASSNGFL